MPNTRLKNVQGDDAGTSTQPYSHEQQLTTREIELLQLSHNMNRILEQNQEMMQHCQWKNLTLPHHNQ